MNRITLLNCLLLAGTTAWLSGCATGALWQEGTFANYHEPAAPPQLSLSRAAQGGDLLVRYLETSEKEDAQRPRAYWLRVNDARISDRRQPHFVSPDNYAGLEPIPTFDAPPPPPVPTEGYAVAATNGTFTLYLGTGPPQVFDLPVYPDPSGRIKQVLLTPLAVVADLTIVGGVIFYACLPGSWQALNGIH